MEHFFKDINPPIVHNRKSLSKKDHMINFLIIGARILVPLGIVGALGCLVYARIDEREINQKHFKQIAEKPLFYDGGKENGCNIVYINTAHLIMDDYFEEDIFSKTDCNGIVTVTPIQSSRYKKRIRKIFLEQNLIKEDVSIIKKPKI